MGTRRQSNEGGVRLRLGGYRARLGDRPSPEDAPQEAAAVLQVLGVLRVIRVGGPPDLNVALDSGAADAIESEHARLALLRPCPNAEDSLMPGGSKILPPFPSR